MTKNDREQLAKAHEMIGDAKAIVEAIIFGGKPVPQKDNFHALNQTTLDLGSAMIRIKELTSGVKLHAPRNARP